jgi:uncharacterized protein YjbJ (UPF0337 family)
MEWSVIQSRWHEYKAAAKRRWDKLSEAQINGTRGNREYLLKRVQEAYAVSREEAERQLAEWQKRQLERLAPSAHRP